MNKERKMTDCHGKGSKESHGEVKKDSKAKGIKKMMSDEELDRDLFETKEQLNVLIKLLQEGKEDHGYKWTL